MRQEDYLKATVGEPQYYKVCTAAFVCGTPNGVEIQGDLLTKPNFEKSKALLKEAGYDGSPVVLMQSTTLPVLTNMAPVTKSLLEQGGFKVDMQSMDWQTVVTRRAKKDPADKGGWSAFHTYAIAADILNPIAANFTVANATRRGSAGPTIRRWRSCATPTPRRPIRPSPRRWRWRCRTARSRRRSTPGSASGTDRAPRAATSSAG